jgi:hypothetical protein
MAIISLIPTLSLLQEVAALYVDRATQLRSRHLLRRGLLQWKVVAAHGKVSRAGLLRGFAAREVQCLATAAHAGTLLSGLCRSACIDALLMTSVLPSCTSCKLHCPA